MNYDIFNCGIGWQVDAFVGQRSGAGGGDSMVSMRVVHASVDASADGLVCDTQVQLRVLATLLTEMDGVEAANDVVRGISVDWGARGRGTVMSPLRRESRPIICCSPP